MKLIHFLIFVADIYIQTSSGWLIPPLITWNNSNQSAEPFPWLPFMPLVNQAKHRGHSKFEGFIVGGKSAKIEEYPWLAQVLRLEVAHCGGVVIGRRVILTAAHCLVDDERAPLDPEDFTVLLGSTMALEGTRYEVCQVKVHKKHLNTRSPPYYYDLGLILLRTEIKLNSKVQIANISPNTSWKKTKYSMVVAGYGVISNDFKDTDKLLKTRLRFVSSAICNHSPTDYGVLPVPNHIFCLISDNKLTGDCVGDSGSGVMWGNYVVGIVSHGRGNSCGSITKASMYVDLTYFREWITENIKKLQRRSLNTCEQNKSNVSEYKNHRRFQEARGLPELPANGLGIDNGIESDIQKYPWTAEVILEDQPRCGGVVLTSRVVATNAHCLLDELENDESLLSPSELTVLVGSSKSLNGIPHSVCEYKIYPKHRAGNIPSYFFDIALLSLSTKIKFDNNAQPAKLITKKKDQAWRGPSTSITVAGFGETVNDPEGNDKNGTPTVEHLRETTMRYYDWVACSLAPNDFAKEGGMPVPTHMFCMLGNDTSNCFGDSGSGVVWKGYLVGLLSTGRSKNCGTTQKPTMYVDVSYFRIWIKKTIKELKSRVNKCKKRNTRRWNPQNQNPGLCF